MIDEKIEYLKLIQEPICRMSTISAIYKGFSATIVAGIATLSYCDISAFVLALSFMPVVAFAILDVYYLKLERKFKFLYEQVRKDKINIDYSLKLTSDPLEIISARAKTWDCIMSPSICLFYPLMITILIIIIILKLKGFI